MTGPLKSIIREIMSHTYTLIAVYPDQDSQVFLFNSRDVLIDRANRIWYEYEGDITLHALVDGLDFSEYVEYSEVEVPSDVRAELEILEEAFTTLV